MGSKRGKRLTGQRTADAVDDNVRAAVSRDASDPISESLCREIDDIAKTKGPCTLGLGRVGRRGNRLSRAFARANWVTAFPTEPPIAGARTVLPG